MKDNKTTRIEIRVTPDEKEYIKQCAKNYELTLSEFVRVAIDKMMKERELK